MRKRVVLGLGVLILAVGIALIAIFLSTRRFWDENFSEQISNCHTLEELENLLGKSHKITDLQRIAGTKKRKTEVKFADIGLSEYGERIYTQRYRASPNTSVAASLRLRGRSRSRLRSAWRFSTFCWPSSAQHSTSGSPAS